MVTGAGFLPVLAAVEAPGVLAFAGAADGDEVFCPVGVGLAAAPGVVCPFAVPAAGLPPCAGDGVGPLPAAGGPPVLCAAAAVTRDVARARIRISFISVPFICKASPLISAWPQAPLPALPVGPA